MSREADIISLNATQLVVGLSAIIGLTVIPGQLSVVIKNSSGGTCWVGGSGLLLGGTFGYLMTAAETLNMTMSGTVYFCAAGTTSVLYIVRGTSSGY